MSKFTVGKLKEILTSLPPKANVEICKTTLYVDNGQKIIAMIDFSTGVFRWSKDEEVTKEDDTTG